MHRRLPRIAEQGAPKLGAWAVWVYHPLITRRLIDGRPAVGDRRHRLDSGRPRRGWRELADLGVSGIVSNDPRLFSGVPQH